MIPTISHIEQWPLREGKEFITKKNNNNVFLDFYKKTPPPLPQSSECTTDPSTVFPRCLFKTLILGPLEGSSLKACLLVSKQWRRLMQEVLDEKIDQMVIGPKLWEKYIGKIHKEYLMPEKMRRYLKKDCKNTQNLLNFQTHDAVFIPRKINNRNLKLENFLLFINKPLNGGKIIKCSDDNTWGETILTYGDFSVVNSCWVLMKNNIEETLSKSYDEQKKMAKKNGYCIPSILQLLVVNSMTLICRETTESLNILTRCEQSPIDLFLNTDTKRKICMGVGKSQEKIYLRSRHMNKSSKIGTRGIKEFKAVTKK